MNDSAKSDQRLPNAHIGQLFKVGFLFLLLLAVLVAIISLPSWQHAAGANSTQDRATEGRAVPVKTWAVTHTPSYQQTQTYTGMVKARRVSDLSFSRAARLARLLVDQGDQVQVGDVLAALETQPLEAKKTRLQAALDRANSELTRLASAARLPNMRAIRFEIDNLTAQLNRLQAQVNNLKQTNTVPQQTQADLDTARQRLEALEAATRDEKVVAQRTAIEELNGQLAELEVAIEESKLKAPFDGVIALRYLNEGALVAPGRPVMRIVEQSDLQAWIGIPVHDADAASESESYVLDVGGQEIKASLFAKLPEVDRTTRSRTVVFSLATDESTQILPGELARIELRQQVESDGFWLPVSALMGEARGLWSVYVAETDEAGEQLVSRCYVEVIDQQGERVRVRGTLDDGDVVIIDGTHRVVPGQKVTSQLAEYEPVDPISSDSSTP